MHPNHIYNRLETKPSFQLVFMDKEGKCRLGVTFDTEADVKNAVCELRKIYAQYGDNRTVGYMEV